MDELRVMARDRGVETLLELDHALGLARELGFRRITTRRNINLRRRSAGGKWENVVGFYVMSSSSDVGLNVGIWREKLDLGDRDLRGSPAPKMGFLNTTDMSRPSRISPIWSICSAQARDPGAGSQRARITCSGAGRLTRSSRRRPQPDVPSLDSIHRCTGDSPGPRHGGR